VFYQLEGEPIFHVDLAIYSDGDQNVDGKGRLAKGRPSSPSEARFWEVSEPEQLSVTIFKRFEGTRRQQYRRVVRYMKRWRDNRFSSGAPTGIAITVAAFHYLQTCFFDALAGHPDDLAATRMFVRALLRAFTSSWDADEQRMVKRLIVQVPQEPFTDLLERLTNKQMETLEERLTRLADALDAADAEVDPVEACKILRREFGDDFPVPEPQETGKREGRAIISSSNSA
jgi:hypothetical protein